MNWSSLGWFTGGIAGGLGAAAIWRRSRAPRVGKIFRVGGRVIADSAVVETLMKRLPPSAIREAGGGQNVEFFMYRRGSLRFIRQPNRKLPGQIGDSLYEMENFSTEPDDIAVELIHYGLAAAGAEWNQWPSIDARGVWRPEPAPLFPSAMSRDRGVQERNALRPAPVTPPKPIGHYFKVGSIHYADENFALTLDGFHGADFDDERRVTIVPFWRRGHLEFKQRTTERMLPEQSGNLHVLESHLQGVDLADLLVELESMGLVSWGGEWGRFPSRIGDGVVTGPLTERSPGRYVEVDGVFLVNEEALRAMIARIPQERGEFAWRGGALRLQATRARAAEGRTLTMYRIETTGGDPRDERVRAFVEEMVMHRLLRRSNARLQFDMPGLIHRVGDTYLVDQHVLAALRARAPGSVVVRQQGGEILEVTVPRTPALELHRDLSLVASTEASGLGKLWILRDASILPGEEPSPRGQDDIAAALVLHQLAVPGRDYEDWDGVLSSDFDPLRVDAPVQRGDASP